MTRLTKTMATLKRELKTESAAKTKKEERVSMVADPLLFFAFREPALGYLALLVTA